MKRLLLVLGLVAGLLFWTPSAALACSCVRSATSADVARADSVFEGTLAWATDNRLEAAYGVNVTRVYKGQAATFEKLRTGPNQTPCGLVAPVADGTKRYLFFVQGEHPGQMQADRCGGSAAASTALVQEVVAATGPGTDPLPARAPTEEAGKTGLGTLGWAVIGGTLVLILGASVVAVRSRPSS